MRHPLLLAVAAAAVVAPSTSFAQSEAPSERVAYRDLNLATTLGRARFERRIAAAVKRVCPAADIRDLASMRVSRRCAAETHAGLKQAVASVLKAQEVALASGPSTMLTAQ
jgi:UrcA family protein